MDLLILPIAIVSGVSLAFFAARFSLGLVIDLIPMKQ